MTKKVPLFSVIIPTYNRQKLLPRALDSLLKQTETNWEAIIMDDGSTDKTKLVAKEYIHHNKKIKYYFHKNYGVPTNINIGANKATGKYLTFLNDDDEYSPNYLSIRKKYILKFPNIDLFYGGVKIIGNHYVPDKNNPQKMIHISKTFVGATMVIKKQIFLKLGGLPKKELAEEYYFLQTLLKKNYKIKKIKNKNYLYRRTNNSITNRIRLKYQK